jgi:hypothetical protein
MKDRVKRHKDIYRHYEMSSKPSRDGGGWEKVGDKIHLRIRACSGNLRGCLAGTGVPGTRDETGSG